MKFEDEVPKYLDRAEKNLLPPSDLSQKVRELQLQLIDLSGAQERKLTALSEQMTAKIERALVTFDQRQSGSQN